MITSSPLILAIESSCDETSAAVLSGDLVLSNIIASQRIHEKFGGVVPELASRAHQSHIVPVVDQALQEAKTPVNKLDVIAFTAGPGLMGSLLVGASFAKSLSLALRKPLIGVNHMQAHVMAHFIKDGMERDVPQFPFLNLTVSGGHTQIVRVSSPLDMMVIGETLDDAAGEAFDKAAKILGLPYPGGPALDRMASGGDPEKYSFTRPRVPELNFSFSGLKTSLLYFIKDRVQKDPGFIERELPHVCASFQQAVVSYLIQGIELAVERTGITQVGLAGGVSANSALRSQLMEKGKRNGWNVFIPPSVYCTDNAAMIGIAGLHLFRAGQRDGLNISPQARMIWPPAQHN